MNKQILDKIREKREFSQLPEKDIEMAYSHYEKRQANEDEKIKLTKELLRKTFSAFISQKLLSLKNKEPEWILRKHISTRERLPYYREIYKRIFSDGKWEPPAGSSQLQRPDRKSMASVIDLGAGINGFSYSYFNQKIKYTAIESVGQLVELMNHYFKQNKLNGSAVHLSLFEKEKVKEIIKKEKKPKIVFMFKVIDALESLKPNYSKELISELAEISDKIVVSFATRSLGSRERFKAKRNWIVDFIKENFNVLGDFEIGGERYLVFKRRKDI